MNDFHRVFYVIITKTGGIDGYSTGNSEESKRKYKVYL